MISIPKVGTTVRAWAYKPIQRFIERPFLFNVNLRGLKYSPANSTVLDKSTLTPINFSATSRIKNSANHSSETAELETVFDKVFESTSLKKLFSDKYKPIRRFEESGNPTTTIIDRRTQEPVEVYIKTVNQCNADKSKDVICYMYKKTPNGKDELIGKKSFGLDDTNRCITPGYMEAFANDRYEGIGTRLHQIAVEQAILRNYNGIYLISLDKAYVFHKKSLFKELTGLSPLGKTLRKERENSFGEVRKILESSGMGEKEINSLIQQEKRMLAIPYTPIEKNYLEAYMEMIFAKFKEANMSLSKSEFNSCLSFDTKLNYYNKDKIEENLRRLMYRKYGKVIPLSGGVNMSLEGKNFEYWKTLAHKQPIFI